jgi:hypothetical protein
LEYKHMNKKVSKETVVIYDTSKSGAFKIWLQINNTDINIFISEKICSKDSVLPNLIHIQQVTSTQGWWSASYEPTKNK